MSKSIKPIINQLKNAVHDELNENKKELRIIKLKPKSKSTAFKAKDLRRASLLTLDGMKELEESITCDSSIDSVNIDKKVESFNYLKTLTCKKGESLFVNKFERSNVKPKSFKDESSSLIFIKLMPCQDVGFEIDLFPCEKDF
jgi:hypothetical protein